MTVTQSTPTLDSLVVGDAVAIANERRSFYSDAARPQVANSIYRVGRVTKDFLTLENGKKVSKRTRRLVGQAYGNPVIPATPELIAKNAEEVKAEREFSAVISLCLSLAKRMDWVHKMSLEQLRDAAALETSFQEAEAAAGAAKTSGA